MSLYELNALREQYQTLENRVAVLETLAKAAGLTAEGAVAQAPAAVEAPIAPTTEPTPAEIVAQAAEPVAAVPTVTHEADGTVTTENIESPEAAQAPAEAAPEATSETAGNTETVGVTQVGPASAA